MTVISQTYYAFYSARKLTVSSHCAFFVFLTRFRMGSHQQESISFARPSLSSKQPLASGLTGFHALSSMPSAPLVLLERRRSNSMWRRFYAAGSFDRQQTTHVACGWGILLFGNEHNGSRRCLGSSNFAW